MRDQIVPPFRRLHPRCCRQHRLQIAILVDQLGRVLRPDSRHARHVIHAVAHQRLHVDHALGPHPELLHHLGRPDRLLLDRIEHRHARPHQLHQVLVGTDDRHSQARRHAGFRISRDQIVGFPIIQLHAGDPESRGSIAHQLELRNQLGRRIGPLRLILIVNPIAESMAARIEYHGQMRAHMRRQEPRHHVGEPEHRVHRRPIPRFIGGKAWNARKIYPDPSTSTRLGEAEGSEATSSSFSLITVTPQTQNRTATAESKVFCFFLQKRRPCLESQWSASTSPRPQNEQPRTIRAKRLLQLDTQPNPGMPKRPIAAIAGHHATLHQDSLHGAESRGWG